MKGRLMAKRSKAIAVIVAMAILLACAGCGGRPDAGLQGVFTKDGLAIVGMASIDEPREVAVKVNGQTTTMTWQVNGRYILLKEPWQPGASYEVSVDGRTWRGVAPRNPTPLAVSAGELGALEETPSLKEWSPVVYEDVAVSRDGRYIGVASFDHNVYLYDDKGKKLWEYRIPGGVGVAVAFSADGSRLFAGESGPDANLYAFETLSGKVAWQYAFAADIGSNSTARWNQRPKINSIVMAGDIVVASAEYTQRVTEKSGERTKVRYVTACVVKAFDAKTGAGKWRYPESGTMDTGVSRLSVSANGGKLAFANHSWTRGQEYIDGSLRILDGGTGRLIGLHQVPPQGEQFSFVGIFDGINISPNGRYLAVLTADDRGMLFDVSSVNSETAEADRQFRLLWQRQISKIQQVGGIPVYAYGNTAHTNDAGQAFFMTGATFLADKSASSGAPPVVHPDATTLFAYSAAGELRWKWQSEGGLSKLRFSRDGHYLAVPVYHNYVTRQKDKSGIYCLDLTNATGEPLVWFYPFEGVAVAAGLAADGTTVAALEAPVRQADDRPLGKHRVHILR